MKLLIVTQVVDTQHTILGFFHRWIEEFAAHCEHVHVVCLEKGAHSLPANVTVHSLGKETGSGKLKRTWLLYKYSWQLRREYDGVFVHMIPLYVLVGAPVWRLLRKPICLWYTHGTVSSVLRFAEKFVQHIYTASPNGCKLASSKVMITGHGIDTNEFAPSTQVSKDIDLITVGRITESKNLLQLVDILFEVRKHKPVSLTLVGAPVTESEQLYEQQLRSHVASLGLQDQVHFIGRVSQAELPTTLNRAKLFVTVAQNGSLDKAVLEAMACSLPLVSMAPGTESLAIADQQVSSPAQAVDQTVRLLSSSSGCPDNRTIVVNEHSLTALVQNLLTTYKV